MADKEAYLDELLYKKGVYLDAIRESEGISEQEIDILIYSQNPGPMVKKN